MSLQINKHIGGATSILRNIPKTNGGNIYNYTKELLKIALTDVQLTL